MQHIKCECPLNTYCKSVVGVLQLKKVLMDKNNTKNFVKNTEIESRLEAGTSLMQTFTNTCMKNDT